MNDYKVVIDVCSRCARIHGLEKEIRKQMNEKYPDSWPLDGHFSLSGYHPSWKTWKELWGAHAVPCIEIWGEDSNSTLCANCLQELSKIVEG